MTDAEARGRAIRAWRLGPANYPYNRRGRLSQKYVAQVAGVSPRTVSNWEHGRTAPSLKRALILENLRPDFLKACGL